MVVSGGLTALLVSCLGGRSRQCRYRAWPPRHVLGAIGSKPRARPISISRPFYLFFSLSSSLAVSRCFSLLVVLVLRRGRAVRAGRVLGLSGAGRRSSFLREGPNGVVLRMEVRLLSSGRACTGWRRRGGETSQQRQSTHRVEETRR
ncbi:hypothetical protein Taro_015733 [Colocasia esculenta]|uniref:Uncharacterized protein n=1 Tax=Colocasia esculenta TaxID=4460 RepID=A0A843UN31_COLES|nr:hypothetical protein [Colocasia esculenta]